MSSKVLDMSRTSAPAGKILKRNHEGNPSVDVWRNKRAAKLSSQQGKERQGAQDLEGNLSEKPAKASTQVASKTPKNVDDAKGSGLQDPIASSQPPAEDVDEAIGHMDSSLLADYFAKQIKRFLGDLSSAELDEKYLPASAFLNTSEFGSSRRIESIPSYLERFAPGGKEELTDTVESTSSPHTLFVTSSGLRAADLTR